MVSSGLNWPYGVAVDVAGNVYTADSLTIKEWTAGNSNVTTLASGLNGPYGVAVDRSGNVYIASAYGNAIQKWTAASNNVTVLLSSGLNHPQGVAVDGAGNVYIANSYFDSIQEVPYAFVDPTPRMEGLAAGSDALPVVLPATANLLAPFAPTSDQSWLIITGITNGVVSFSFTANTGSARTAHITLLGQSIPITQGVIGTPPTLTGMQMLGNGACQFSFTNTVGASFTVLSTSDLSLPLSNWTVAGTASNTAPGQFQFTTAPVTNDPQLFYTVRSP
jgi:DNA-binding beta-propeller fold protein YncE